MNEELYFFVDEKSRECGPFSEDELNYVGLYEDSLIYRTDWNERKPLNQINELKHISRKNESILQKFPQYGTKVLEKRSAENEITEKNVDINPYSPKKKNIRILTVSWLFFHCIALLFSSIEIQNKERGDSYGDFWPFVDFLKAGEWHPLYGAPYNRPWNEFQGLFYEYDLSEFAFYTIVFVFIWFLLYTKNQKS
jgi:CRISPR/Cas system-associated protein endoribonuclease Cas2